MNRPQTRAEISKSDRQSWYREEGEKARNERGEKGAMEFWLRLARIDIAREEKAGRVDVFAGFALVVRLFMVALAKRTEGDHRIWNDLLRYADEVVARNPPRH